MKQKLFKTMLLLCALVAGSTSVWGADTYEKVTSAPSDWSGTYVIVADESNVIFTGQSGSNNYGGYTSVTITSGTVTGDYSDYEVLVEKSGDYYTIKHVNSSKYLGWTSGNNLFFSTSTPSANTYKWVLSTSSILNANDTSRKLQYNSGSPRFACYTSSQKVAYLYKKQAVVKTDPTITFNSGSVRVGQNLNLSTLFTSDSEGAVTYSITAGGSYASLDGSTLTGVEEGSVTVKAQQAAAGNYNAGEATATITVNPALALSSIAITTAPTKTTYNEGETFDPTGMVVTATYSDASTNDVTAFCTFSPSTSTALTTSDTEITISYTENAVEKTTTQAITVNEVVDYATLPFAFDGGSSDFTSTTGFTQNGLGGDYGSSPKLKFDTTGDYLILKINELPGTLTFDIKGNPSSGTWLGTFKVQASSNGSNYADIATYEDLTSTVVSKTIDNLASDVRYIKWIYTYKGSGNVALGNIELAAYGAPVNSAPVWSELPTPSINVNTAYELDLSTYVSGTPTPSITLNTSVSNSLYEFEDGYLIFQPTAAGTYEFTFTATNTEGSSDATLTVTATAPTPSTGVKWIQTNLANLTENNIFVIVGNNGSTYALTNNNGTSSAPSTAAVTIENSSLSGAIADNIKWNLGIVSDGHYTFYPNGDTENWLYCTDTNNGVRVGKGDNKEFTLVGDYLYNTGTVRYMGIYNSADWRCYTSINTNIQNQTVSFYKQVESVILNAYGYATFASTSPLDFTGSEAAGYSAWQITGVTGTTINFSQITGAVAAGTGVLLKGTASDNINIPVAASGSDISGTNKLIGVTTDTDLEQVDGSYTNFGLSGDEFKKVASAGATIPANKAYLHILTSSLPSSVKALTFMFEDDADGLERVQHVQEVQGAIFNLAGQRLSKMQKGINIVNGKKILY